jgi:outer membrane receptor protein involved in Fe transport
VLRKLSDKVSLTASAYRSFRAPTLNELYRSFRVGDVVTLSNDKLRAERLTGGEAGVRFAGLGRKLDLRGTFFWSEITRPIANVTLSVIPGLIRRERQNLGRTGSRGVELDANAHLTSHLNLSGSYQFADAKVLRFPANTALEGLLIPQVPRNLFTFQASYSKPSRVTLGAQARFGGAEFDDDQNQLRLDRYFTWDALISRPVGHGVEVFAAGENLLNQRFTVGRTPIRTIGPPLLVRVGIRFQLGLP